MSCAQGLSLIRLSRVPDALASLAKASSIEPDNTRYAYVHAIALHDSGQGAQAVKALESALKRHPHDVNLLSALVAYENKAGHTARAQMWESRLREQGAGE